MPFDRTNSVAILRCVDFGEMEAALLERLRSYFGANIVIQRNVEAETRPFALDVPNDILVLSADTSAIRNLGLVAPADWGWRCGDYAQIHVADHLQEFDHYWMFEPDVFFNFRELADFFGPLESNDADFLAPQLSRRDNQWAHFRSVEEIFPEVWGCLYPVTRISRRAIAAVHQARRDYGEAWLRQAAPRSFANDESFVCSALHAAGFRMESLNTASPSVFPDDNYSFTFNRLILRERVEREESVVLHPVVSSAVFFDKLRPRMTKNIMPHLYYYSEIVREMGDDETNAWFGRKAAEVIRARHDTRKDSRGTETASSAEISLISEKVRESMWKNSSQKDFGLHAPMKIDAIDFRRNLPYAADFSGKTLFLTDTVREQVFDDPFLFLSQYQHASYLIEAPLEALPKSLEAEANRRGSELTFVFSIGRCGSTLVSNMAKAANTVAYSECDALVGMPLFNGPGRRPRMEMLLRRIVGAMQVYAGKQPTLIKMKSWSCRDIEWFTHCFPRARFLFISRSTTDWATSFIETFDHQPRTLLSTLKVGAAAHRHLEETGRLTNFIRYEEFARAPVALMKGILGLDVDAGLDGRLSEVASQNSQGKVLTKTEMPREELEARLVQLKQLISEDSALLASPIVYERDWV